jgi:excisionase family DNA binding protein
MDLHCSEALMRKRKLSPREVERRQRQRDEAAAGSWGDMHEATRESGLGRSTISELIADEKIRSAKVGKRRLIHIPSLLDYIDSRATGPPAPGHEPPGPRPIPIGAGRPHNRADPDEHIARERSPPE